MPGLSIEQISLTRLGRTVLDGVSFDAPRGHVSVVVAPSGAGKSTLLRCLNRLIAPDAGRICLDGIDIAAMEPRSLRRRVGLIGQLPVMLPGTVAENLGYGLAPLSVAAQTAALEDAGLDASFAPRPAEALSGGERARVALARALVRAPEMLVLDEPTAALDADTGHRVATTLRRLARDGFGVILATHDLPLAREVADRVTRLDAGTVTVGEPEAMLGASTS